ncbi:uncharacterized protein LOC144163396 isoform X2 [Haemaphysalis longicornis]
MEGVAKWKAPLGPKRGVAKVENVPKPPLAPRRSLAYVPGERKLALGPRKSAVALASDVPMSPEVQKFMDELADERRRSVTSPLGRTRAIRKGGGPPKESAFERLMQVQPPPAASTSTLDDPYPLHTDQPGKWFGDRFSPHSRLLVVLCIVLGVLAAAAFLAYSLYEYRRRSTGQTPQLLTGVLQGCRSTACKQALGLIKLSLDASADPCQDAYAMACGRWSQADEEGVPLSYKKRLLSSYMATVHRQLAATGSQGLTSTPDMAVPTRIYTSCIAFFHYTSTSIADIWAAIGVNVTRWLAVKKFAELFSLMVHAVVASRFDSSFAIGHRADTSSALLTVRTGRSLNTAVVATRARQELIREAGRAMRGLEGFKEDVEAEDIIQLDDSAEHVTKAYAKTEAKTLVDLAELDDSARGVNWAPVLRSAVDSAQLTWKELLVHPIKRVFVNDVAALRSLVALLGAASLKTAVRYALLVPVAEYMSLEYNASVERTTVSFNARRRTCLGGLQVLLGTGFLSALGGLLQGPSTVKLAADMWESVRRQGAAMRTVAKELELDEGILLGMNMVAEGANGSWWNTTFAAHKDLYGDNFIANLAVHARLTDRRVPARAMLEAKPSRTDMIPTAYLLPDFFYPGVSELSVNYGTLGTHMGALFFNAAIPRALLAKHEHCFADYARENFQLDAHGSALEVLLRTKWAVEVSLAAWKSQRGALGKYAPLSQLFFLRLAITFCGEDERRRAALRFATRTSPAYAWAFGCPEPPPVPC